MAEQHRQRCDTAIRVHEAIELFFFLSCFGHRIADHHEASGQNLQVVAFSSHSFQARFHVRVVRLPPFEIATRSENHLRRFCGELTAGFGCPSLNNDGPSLDRARDVECAVYGKVGAFVIEGMQFVRIEKDPRFRVSEKRVVGPAIPQSRDDVEELATASVALVVFEMLFTPEVPRLVGIR